MRKVYVNHLSPGLVLGKTLTNERGDILLLKGVPLTQSFIDSLLSHGYYTIWVMDGVADDIEPPDLLSDRVHIATARHLQDLFTVVHGTMAADPGGIDADALSSLALSSKPQIACLHRDVESIMDEVEKTNTLSGVSWLKTHDNYTFEHSIEVAVSAVLLGKRLELPTQDLQHLALASLYHDIGKLSIPAEILEKPDALTDEERALIRRHPQMGYQMVRPLTGDGEIIPRGVVKQHHERQDGTGYPEGLRGSNRFNYPRRYQYADRLMLPAAEIVAVADVYSALSSDRPFRRAFKPPEVASILRELAGTHLNREIVLRFLSVLPTYPVGTQVVVVSDKLWGFRGVVTAIDLADIHRPTVRMLSNSLGRSIAAFEVDTRKEKGIELALAAQEVVAVSGAGARSGRRRLETAPPVGV